MADDEEKTEEPTSKKIEDAKKEGNVGKSTEVVGAAVLLFGSVYILFFQTGMYEMTLVILVKSFSVIHLGTFDIFSYNGIQLAIDEVKRMFTFAFAFALPLFFIGFIMDVYYGYGTKSMPAFSPFIITFQLKFALIFIFLILGMEIFADAFTQYFIDKFQ